MKFKSDNELPKSNTKFLKLEDGGFAKGVFVGDPVDFKKAFKPDEEPKFRFMINFVVLENGVYTAKIFEQGISVYKSIRKFSEIGYDLSKTMMVISRSGTGTNTEYTIMPAPDGALSPEEAAQVQAVKLNELIPNV